MKKIITLSILFLGIVFLAGCDAQQKNNQALPLKSIPADWKTYSDQKNGFEFKYPASWIFTDNNKQVVDKRGQSPWDAYLSIKTSDYTFGDKRENDIGAMFFLTASRQKKLDGTEIPIVECKDYPGLKLTECPPKSPVASLIKINGITAILAKINNTITASFTNNGYSYSLHFLQSDNFLGGDEIFNQIISTFKLTK